MTIGDYMLDPPDDDRGIEPCDGCGEDFPVEELARIIRPDGSKPLWCEDCAYRAEGLAELLHGGNGGCANG